ncbi:hypothetical protein PV325_002942 [Microctonus aethiopoides]|nr:hypothetical protein PV325_002942 [Microctonus aethiopoides]KAK0096677.1 hypothetical protein PV326_004756 [Microctonus aethiopoides]
MEEENIVDCDANEFYTRAVKYWDNIPATVDGMLGGFGFISHIDINGSEYFLESLYKLKDPPGDEYALDCGSGIGRITKNLLAKHFKCVDLVEQNSKFLDAAKVFLEDCSSHIGEFYSSGLQDFRPDAKKYDVIWSQWVLGHLENDDLINFFKNCTNALKDNGILIVKENVTSSNIVEKDTQDSSVTRPYDDLKAAFKSANLICIKERKQAHLPRGLYPVYMFALKPSKVKISD